MEDYTSYAATCNVVKPAGKRTSQVPDDQVGRGGLGEIKSLPQNITSRVITLSAKDERGVKAMAEHLKDYITAAGIRKKPKILDDLAYTLGQCRTRFPWTVSLQAESVAEVAHSLDPKSIRPLKSSDVPRLGFGELSTPVLHTSTTQLPADSRQFLQVRVLSGGEWAASLLRATQSSKHP